MENKKYRLDVNLRPQNEVPLFSTEKKTFRDKMLTKFFGQKRRYLIIVPSESIDSISFTEAPGVTGGH
ncbi:MAG: hypothetical protein NC093_10380 [Alistipes sp.]|nr:hypothetical protein [Alistipes sp.]